MADINDHDREKLAGIAVTCLRRALELEFISGHVFGAPAYATGMFSTVDGGVFSLTIAREYPPATPTTAKGEGE